MGLREQLSDDLKAALRSGDERRKLTIRSIKTAITRAETAGEERITLDDAGILAVIAREAKQRRESIIEFQKGGRADLVEVERQELTLLESYLPQQMERADIEAVARAVIAEVGANDPTQLGLVMKPLMARLKGQADGRLVQQIARELLSGPRQINSSP
ncbi:MAG: GatB/YqeY domain-containing protein [Anaerolineae bacterium]|nr:GatB/YqeY domain-containing protein [Anaerolineae bacterium]